jgi:bifunctional pyridoxal-dependent enzyme with beta-cystathionase and maltose regulon repressor activities
MSSTKTIILSDMNFPTSTVNVLPHLQELRDTWREQDFRYTKEQQEQFDMLLQARRERVKWFYETNRVQIGPKIVKKEEDTQEDQDS